VVVRDPELDERRFARVKVPDLLPRFVVLPDGERFVPLEQVIAGPFANPIEATQACLQLAENLK
jgi:polyphosphate kinase